MALIDRLTLDAVEVRRFARAGLARARSGLVRGLRTVADALREETDVVVEPAARAAVTPEPPPAPVEPPAPEPVAEAAAASSTPSSGEGVDAAVLHDRVIDVLHTIFDPEIPVDIYDLGLIYAVEVSDEAAVHVRMTLTSPNCPAAQSLPGEVEVKVRDLDGVTGATVEVVFEPPWTPDLMSEEAKLELNIL